MAPFCKHVCIQYTHVHAHFHVRMQSRKQNITDRVSLPVRESYTMLHSGPLQTEDPSILCQFGFSTSWDAEKLATVFRGCMMCGKIHWSLSFILVDPSWRFSSLMTLALGESRISPWRGTRDFQINGHPVAIFTASLGVSLNPFSMRFGPAADRQQKLLRRVGKAVATRQRDPNSQRDELILSMWEINVAASLVWIELRRLYAPDSVTITIIWEEPL